MDEAIKNNLERLLASYTEEDLHPTLKPLKSIGIHHFHFVKIFNDGSRTALCGNKRWLDHFYSGKLYPLAYFAKYNSYATGNVLWNDLKDPADLLEARENFGLTNNGLSVIIKKNLSTNCYHFSAKSAEIVHGLFKNINLLHQYIHYFNERTQPLLNDIEKIRIPPINKPSTENNMLNSNVIEKFKKLTAYKKVYIEERNCYLTFREMTIIKEWLKGESGVEIAKKYHLSPHTVQTHINNIKSKLNCNKMLEVFNILQKENIL